jgi:hypothetical protein
MSLAVTVLLFLFNAGLHAEETRGKTHASSGLTQNKKADTVHSEDNLLDFQDQVIEGSDSGLKTDESGRRQSSPVFDELGKGDTSMDSIIFRRSDFNDFHNLQMNQHVFVQSAGAP